MPGKEKGVPTVWQGTMMDNPFRFGEPVTGDHFIGRDNEVSEIVGSAKAQKNLVIRGERHIGKSSLLAETARRNAKDFLFVKVDSCAVSDEYQFLDCFTREVIKSGVGRAWRIEPALWDLLSTRRMRAALSPSGNLAISDTLKANMPESTTNEKGEGKSAEPQDEKEESIRMCGRCGRPLKWIETYKRFFCYSCKKYAPRQKKMLIDEGGEWPVTGRSDSCPRCGSTMRYSHRYSEYYCEKCGRYPRLERLATSEPWAKSDVMAAFDLPQRLSELKGKPVVMMLDEVQGMGDIWDAKMLEMMRLKFEEHEDVTYVFAGGANESMRVMFEDGDGPFFKFGRLTEVGRLPEPELKRFLMSRFRSGDGRLSEEAAARIAGISEGIPMYAQQIGHELFHISKTPEMADVEAAIGRVVRQQSQVYSLLWDSIRSPLHRRYLFAVAREPGVPHGEAFIQRYGLKSRSHVQRIESQLEARGVIGNGEVLDPLFVQWLRMSHSA